MFSYSRELQIFCQTPGRRKKKIEIEPREQEPLKIGIQNNTQNRREQYTSVALISEEDVSKPLGVRRRSKL